MKKGLTVIGILLVILLLTAIGYYFNHFKESNPQELTNCLANLVYLRSEAFRYAEQHDDHWPDKDAWCDILKSNEDKSSFTINFKCPESNKRCGYAINKNLPPTTTDTPSNMVLFFESDLGWNGVGGEKDVAKKRHRYENKYGFNCVTAGEPLCWVWTEEISSLRWTKD